MLRPPSSPFRHDFHFNQSLVVLCEPTALLAIGRKIFPSLIDSYSMSPKILVLELQSPVLERQAVANLGLGMDGWATGKEGTKVSSSSFALLLSGLDDSDSLPYELLTSLTLSLSSLDNLNFVRKV
ncbi:hypothetical protein HAX54_035881 [Datura stramonium]|uniref:Uncharacterized protein n=1 Tax=Datura stramonium TaxID=4076 RepID=A0ABS8VHK9_DATST|nr:hypothetical protein [Datura stramonium]